MIRSQQTERSKRALPKRGLIVTIDGPAGAGKSTVGKLLAARLGYLYLDTGALYRAVAWKVRASGLNPSDSRSVAELVSTTSVTLEQDTQRLRVRVDGQDVTEGLRTPEISRIASIVSAIPAVREELLPVQRRIGAAGGVVAEGRDLGTRVFPQADVKFFLDAGADIRAVRRHREVMASGRSVPLDQTRQELDARDARDRGRHLAPLVAAADATVIDTSALGVDQVVAHMLAVIATKL